MEAKTGANNEKFEVLWQNIWTNEKKWKHE
jgi:hypothetical protein